MARRYFPRSVAELVHWYERFVSPLSLVAGFLADNFIFLRRVDLIQTDILLGTYLVIAALGIIVLNLIETGRWRHPFWLWFAPFIPVLMQFAFGGLFSGYLSLYSRAASLAVSWIFVFVLAGVLLANERFTRLYSRFSFQLTVYFGVLFSFLTFFLPVLFHRIGLVMFFISGAVSIAVVALLLALLSYLVPEVVKKNWRRTIAGIGALFITFNVLYVFNVIPPLPLSLKAAGVYHSVKRSGNGYYILVEEPLPWYEYYLNYNTVYHIQPSEPVYVFSSVFAPAGLSTSIVHEWQYYNDTTRQWQTKDVIQYNIHGGRDGGYGGYSLQPQPDPGQWRVNVRTSEGQLIGRISFTVLPALGTTTLTTITQ